MKVTGLITEYNPFHNGHRYHLQKAKELTNADYIIVVISGDYVQRGTPAIMDKYLRTQIALEEGADLVLLLPVSYSCASAEYFAMGAVSILDKLGVVDYLCFGSESGNLQELFLIASYLSKENSAFQQLLKQLLKQGFTYPAARNQALLSCPDLSVLDLEQILTKPNNILGIEYLKSLLRRKSNITPITISRIHSQYHDTNIAYYSSATAIRRLFIEQKTFPNLLSRTVSPQAFSLYQKYYNKTYPIYEDDFSLPLYYQLLKEQYQNTSLLDYQDISSDLEKRIFRELDSFRTFSDFIQHIKTKQYTQTRISRSLLHILLQLRTSDYIEYASLDYIPYIQVLGFQKNSVPLLSAIKAHTSIPFLTKMANAKKQLSSAGIQMLQKEVFASTLYRKVQEEKFFVSLPHEYARGILLK